MFHNGWWTKLLLTTVLLASTYSAFAQTAVARQNQSTDLQTRARELNEIYRSKAVELISTYIQASRFYVEVDVVPRVSGVVELPYIPKNSLNFGGNSKLLDDVQNLISSVRVTLKLPSSLSSQTQQQLSEILFRELPLDRWRGDSISVRTFHVTNDSQNVVVPPVSAQANGQVNPQLLTNSDAIKNVGPDLVSDDSSGWQSLATLAFWKRITFLQLIGFVAVGIAACIALISAMLLARGLLSIGGGLKTVSSTLERTSRDQLNSQRLSQRPLRASPKPQRAPPRSNEKERFSQILHVQTSGSIDRQIRRIQEKVSASLATDGSALGCAVELANRYLSSTQEASKAVVLFELLPDVSGHDIYSRLGVSQKRLLQTAAQEFQAGLSKPQLTVGVGDELIALIRSRSLSQSESESSHRIREFLCKIDDEEIARLLPAINADVLPRFIFYLSSQRLASILSTVHTTDSSFTNRISWALLALPNIEEKLHLDQPILNILDAMQDMVRRREANRYFPHLKEVVENLPPRLRKSISENLANMNEDFARFSAHSNKVSAIEEVRPAVESDFDEIQTGTDFNSKNGKNAA